MLKSLKILHLPESALLFSKACRTTEDMNKYLQAHKHILSERNYRKTQVGNGETKKKET